MTPSSIVADEPVAAALVVYVVADATLVAYPVVCVIALSAVMFSPSAILWLNYLNLFCNS